MNDFHERVKRVFGDSYIKPILRTKIDSRDVFVADGFVPADQMPFFGARFGGGISETDFPNGCYATVWLTPVKTGFMIGVATFEPTHDVESISLNSRQAARINKTLEMAREGFKKAKLH